jgi:hypothetical protein
MKPLLLSLLLVPLSACSSFGPAVELDAARERWSEAGFSDYVMTLERSCFCPAEYRGPFNVTVQNGQITSVEYEGADMPSDRALSVNGLFDLIDDAFASGADKVEVTYHPRLGYPTNLFIDYETQAADEEVGVVVTGLTSL